MDIKSKVLDAILDKSTKIEDLDLTKSQIKELEELLKSVKKSSIDAMSIDTGEPMAMSTEVIKFDDKGQWSIEKGIKPGKTLDYSKMNEIKPYESESKAPTINYKEMETGPEIERRVALKNKQEQRRKQSLVTPDKSALETIREKNKDKD